MPRSTLSAVGTPVSDMPSSTSVMATAGRMPTTTVAASSTLDMAAMLASMRPMNESTISSDEMSISTPRARLLTIWLVRSSCRVSASLSCMSTWMETRRNSAILMIGIRSISGSVPRGRRGPGGGGAGHGEARALQRNGEGVGQRGLRRDRVQVDPEVHDRLCDLWPDAADDAVGAHQPRRRHRLEQVLGDQRVHGGHAGDVDDSDGGARLDDAAEQILHHHLRPRAVQRSDERQAEHALPELDDRRGQLQHLALLMDNDLLAALLVDLGGVEPEAVEGDGHTPHLAGEGVRIAAELLSQSREERLLEGEHERRRLRRRETLTRAGA